MSFTMEDNLESGWVAVRPNVFEEKEKHKFVFIVAWNEIEGKFAITCHNRTVQRRSIAKDPGAEGTLVSVAGATEYRSSKSPVKEKDDGGSQNRTKGRQSDTNSHTRGAATGVSSPVKSGSKVVGPRGKSPTAVLDIEILDPTGEHHTAELGEVADSEDFEHNVREDCSWAGLFSFQDLRAVHLQLCSVNSDLEPCLPPLPEEPSGMWTVLFGPPEVTRSEMDTLCYQLQVYLGHSLDTCGWKILSQVLFTESDDPEEYYESLSELRQKGYEDALHRAKKRLQELLEKHKAVDSMVELLELYQEEDEAYGDLAEATTQLYQYLLQPFRDMRELAMLRRQQIKISMETDYLGPRRVEALRKEDADWQRKAHEAVLCIQDFTVKYFETTARAQKAAYERMRADQKRLGKAAWAAAVPRMEKLQHAVSTETMQLMRAKEICLEQRKHALREEMQGLQGGEDAMSRLHQLEALYYELQLQLYEIQFEILKYEELLLTAQLDSIRRQMMERQDEVVYYDTYESPDAIRDTEDGAPQREELHRLQQRTRQLEARRGRITAKKAYLRHKKEICIANHNEKMQHRQDNQGDYTTQDALQQRRDQEEEERKNSGVSERQKTLDRLRSFKQQYPGQVVLKSTRLRMAHARRRSGGASSWRSSTPDQPRSLCASVQTEESAASLIPGQPGGYAASHRQLESASLPPGGAAAASSREAPWAAPGPASLPPLREPSALGSPAVTPPPPPPPPLPPPPSSSSEDIAGEGQPGSPARSPKKGGEEGSATVAPPAARFFDSGQLQNARKKLRKTSAQEASQRRRLSSPMDEVLASLKRGCFHLRKVEQRVPRPDPDEDDADNILVQIRKGVKLKQVQRRELRDQLGGLRDSAHPLTRSIHEALRRIKEASPESDSEDEGLPCADWEC
ncbi:junction-mediating and -regulatory protein-like isoform X2 [Anguilla rostrata]|uniref:junction-mediating and -regulatory protein-like isoform X2 n=1 Tax=Anguilla rostrata TaxID=7938 RepID=UPI0030D1237F